MADETFFVVLDPTMMEQATLVIAEQILLSFKFHENPNIEMHVYCCFNETSVVIDPDDDLKSGLQHTRQRITEWVERLVQHSRNLGLTVQTEIEYGKDWRSAIVKAIDRCGPALVFKNMSQHGRMVRLVRETSDWKLLRDTKSPVFLVKSSRPQRVKKILVAIKHNPEDPVYDAANDRILTHAKWASENLGAELHAVTCYEHKAYPDRQKFADRCGLPRNRVTASTGVPEKVIASTAREVGADLIIIARVAQPNSKKALGDTAQKVIDETTNDVLVLQMTN